MTRNSESRKRLEECDCCIDGKRPSPNGPIPCFHCGGTGIKPEDEK